MAELTHAQYDQLERAVLDRKRIAIYRRGTEYIVVPERLRTTGGHEVIEATHPTTGDRIEFDLGEVDSIEVITR